MSNQNSESTTCRIVCILLGLAAAAFVWYLLTASLSNVPLLLICLFTWFVTSHFLYDGFCGGSAESDSAEKSDVSVGSVSTDPKTLRAIFSGESGTPSTAGFVSGTSASKAKPQPKPKAAAKPKTAAKSTASKSRSAKASAPKAASSKTAAKPRTAAKSKSSAASKGPQLFTSKPKDVDDLKMIAGVGPGLEKTLNGIGVYQFKQVAGWKKADIAFVDERLKFKGRIERDDWVKQAKALAKGGEAEYIKVFGKKPR